MSLLLDALKKAAKEKQSADSSNTDGETDEGLVLDSLDESVVEDLAAGENDSSTHVRQDTDFDKSVASLSDGMSATPLTVSDEALDVLVHKANKQYKSNRAVVWGSIFFTSVAIMILGGVYFYFSMTDDLESIEKRHRLVMRSVTDTQLSRAVTEKIEKQNALEAAQKKIKAPVKKETMQTVLKQKTKTENNQLVIKKINKVDPIDVLATKAWTAYIEEDYNTAKSVYKKVLNREENNRDALLGLAAIAVKQGDIESAKSIYGELVELNPRDPIAVAALSNLETVNLNNLGESKLKLMIRKNSNPSHLYFALGNVYSQQSRWPEAQKSYFNAWQSDTNNADYAFNLAVSLDQLGKQKEAIKFYKTSLTNANLGNTQFSVEAAESRLLQLSGGQ